MVRLVVFAALLSPHLFGTFVPAAATADSCPTADGCSEEDVAAALEDDDTCVATEADCALSALQLRAKKAVSQGPTCTGDGTPFESPACKYNTAREGCMWTAGCNWGGANGYGGWCTGSPGCAYLTSASSCADKQCSWVAATASLLEADVAQEQQHREGSTGPACTGDGSASENAACKYISAAAGCVYTPGCDWAGVNSFGGRCIGGPQCTFIPHAQDCSPTSGCQWLALKTSLLSEVSEERWSRWSFFGRRRGPSENAAPTCQGDGSPNESPACKYNTAKDGCLYTPGCNWGGASGFGGWCTGGPSCAFQTQESTCSDMKCSWVKASASLLDAGAEASAAGSTLGASAAPCTGDGSAAENPACKYISSAPGCIYTPGCDWAGVNSFGGRCVGGLQCTFIPRVQDCSPASGCQWLALKPSLLANEVLGAEGAGQCKADGTAAGNPGCQYVSDRTGCMYTVGCNWDGASAFGGWCTGGPSCTYQSRAQDCSAPGCSWVASIAK